MTDELKIDGKPEEVKQLGIEELSVKYDPNTGKFEFCIPNKPSRATYLFFMLNRQLNNMFDAAAAERAQKIVQLARANPMKSFAQKIMGRR